MNDLEVRVTFRFVRRFGRVAARAFIRGEALNIINSLMMTLATIHISVSLMVKLDVFIRLMHRHNKVWIFSIIRVGNTWCGNNHHAKCECY